MINNVKTSYFTQLKMFSSLQPTDGPTVDRRRVCCVLSYFWKKDNSNSFQF